jgi:hypothetical protein
MVSGSDDWVYWHFFTITTKLYYNSSHIELPLNSELWFLSDECSLKDLWLTFYEESL